MIEKKIYTIEELKDVPLFELRLLLRELGGKPGTKNISKIKEEIIAIQSGKLIPKPSNRGRKPKISPSDKEMLTDEKAGNEKIEGDTKQEKTAEYLPFYKRGDSDKIYQSANAYVPLTLRVCDIEGENISEVIIAEGVLEILPDGDGYLRTYEYGINRKEFHLDKKIIKT